MRQVATCIVLGFAAVAARAADSYSLNANLAEPADPGGYDVIVTGLKSGAILLDWADGKGIAVAVDGDGTRLLRCDKSAQELGHGEPCNSGTLRIRRRASLVEASCDGKVLVRGWLPDPPSGMVGPAAGTVLEDCMVQAVGEPVFDYGFADLEGVGDIWEDLSGKWRLGVNRDDLYQRDHGDFGPFGSSWYQIAEPASGLTAAGLPFWDRYRARVAVLPPAETRVGLAFYVQDKRNHALFSIIPGSGTDAVAILSVVRDDVEEIVAREFIKWRTDIWQELSVEAYDSDVRCFVAGRQVLRAQLPLFTCGAVGLYADGPGEPRFDDVSVRPLPLEADFEDTLCLGAWSGATVARWGVSDGLLRAQSDPLAECLVRDRREGAVQVSAVVESVTGRAGVCEIDGSRRGYAMLVGEDDCRLVRVDAGETTVLQSAPLEGSCPVEVKLCVDGGRIWGQAGDRELLAYDSPWPGGRAGVIAQGKVSFDDFSAGPPPERGALISRVSGERLTIPGEREGTPRPVLGYVWRTGTEGGRGRGGARWTYGQDAAGNPALTIRTRGDAGAELWYAWPCPGDAELVATGCTVPDGAALGLAIAYTPGEADSGYAAVVSGGALRLLRKGQAVAETDAGAVAGGTLRLYRDGDFVVAASGDDRLVFHDEQPLEGTACGIYGTGSPVITEAQLRNRKALHYSFRSVETDWQPEQGTWKTHSGMACIAWDYWLTGIGTPVAMAYNLRPQPADLYLECWVSEHTLGYSTGEHRHFPYHDVSFVTCARERSRDSGYRFVVGAEGGQVTRLLKLGQIVAETNDSRFRIVMGGHCNTPRNIHVAVTQRGGRMTLLVNGEQALQWTDPDPLPGGLVGIGVEDCAANFRDLWMAPIGRE